MADVHRDPRDLLECVQEPDAAVSIQETKEGGPASTATPGIKREGEEVGMTTVRASDLPPLDVSGTNSPRTRVGRGLESIGGMTADTFQRFTTVVGGVVKSPVTLMAKVGSLASPQAANRTSPLAASRTSSRAASPTLPLPASPTSPKAASFTLPEAATPTSPQAQSLTSPQAPSPTLPEEASLALPEEASPTLPEAPIPTLPEAPSLTLPEAPSPTLPEEASLALPEAAIPTSPQAASVTSSPSMSLEERVCQLEIQMKSFEERFNLGTVMTELNASPRSLEENPRLARSLMQEMETEGTLEKRVQMLEESVHERMESVEKALSIIQSQLAHVDLSKYDSVAGYDSHDSPSGELEFYDAEQQVEILEILELNSFQEMIADARYERGEDTGASAPLEEIPANKAVPTAEELVQEINAGRSSDVSLELQLAHTSVESKQFFLPELMEAAALNAELVERTQELDAGKSSYVLLQAQAAVSSVESTEPFVKEPREAAGTSDEISEYSAQREDGGTFPVSSDRQLVSTLSDLHEAFVTEPSAAAASAKFLDIARADSAEKSSIAPVYFEPQSASVPEVPQETFEEQQPLIASSVADFEEPADEDVFGKSGIVTLDPESPLAPLLERPHIDSVTEPLAVVSSAESAQELAINEDSDMARTPSEPQAASMFVEEPSAALLSANLDEPAQEDVAEKSGTMLAAKETPSASLFEEPQEDFAKESLAASPSAELAQVLATNEDGYMALASSDTQVASRFAEEPPAAIPSDHFEEPAQEDAADKSETMLAAEESPLLASSEELEDNSVKEPLAAAPSAGPAHGLATESSDAVAPAFSEPQVASRSVEFPSVALPNDNAEEPAENSPLLSSFREPQEESVEESLAAAPSAGPAHGLATEASDAVAPAFSEPQVALRSVEFPSATVPNDSVEELAEELPLLSSYEEPQEDSVKESLAGVPSAGPAQGLASQANDDVAPAFSEPQVASRALEYQSAAVPNDSVEEPAQEDAADKSGTLVAAEVSPLVSSFEEPEDNSVQKSLAAGASAGLAYELLTREDSDIAPASSEPQETSKSVEEPSAAVRSASFEEPVRDITADESGTMLAAEESPLMSSLQEPKDDHVKESLAATPSADPAHGLATEMNDAVAPAVFEPQVVSKFVEDPSAAVPNDSVEEPAQEDAQGDAANKSETMLAAEASPLLTSSEEPEDNPFEKSSAGAPSAGPAHELATEVNDDVPLAFSLPQLASKSVEYPSAAVLNDNVEEPAHEDAAEKSGTMPEAVDSPLLSSLQEPEDDTAKEFLAAAPIAVPAYGLPLQEDSGGYSDKAVPELRAASTPVEEQLAAIPSTNFEAPAREDAMDKDGTMLAPMVSPSAASFEEPQEGFEKEILAPAQESVTREDSDVAPAFSEPQVASKLVEESSAAVPSANLEEPAAEDADDTSGINLAAKVSSAASSFEEPEVDTVKESLVDAPSAGSARELLPQVNSSGSSDMAVAEPLVASITEEDPSAAISSANFEEPAREHAAEKNGTMLAAEDSPSAEESPSASSFEGSQEVFAKDSLAAAPSAEPAQKLETNEDSDMAPAFSELQVASRSVEEPSAAVSSATLEEPAQEDVAEKSDTMLAAKESPSTWFGLLQPLADGLKLMVKGPEESPSASSFEEPQEVFAKDSSAVAPSAELAQKLETNEVSDMARASPDIQVASRSVEEPSAAVPSANFEEPVQEDVAEKSVTMLAAKESPSVEESSPASSFEEPHEDFAKESLAAAPSAGSAHELAVEDSNDVAPAFSKPQVASRSVEDPSAAVPSANFEEPAHEDEVDKNRTMLAAEELPPLLSSFEEPQEDFMKESLPVAPSAGPAHGLATAASDDAAPAFYEPQVASKFVEDPSAAVSNDNVEEHAQEDAQDKNGTLLTAVDSPLLSSSEEPEDNPVKESLVAGASAGLAHELVTREDSDMGRASLEPQEASRSVEEPPAAIPCASFEEPAQKDAADKNRTVLAAGESPLLSLSEEPEVNPVKESLAAAPYAGPAHGLATEASDDVAPAFSEPQVASKFVEEPLAAVPNDNVEEPAGNSPLLSSFQEPQEDSVKESLAAAPSAGPASGLATEASDDVAPAFFEPQVASKFVEDPSAALPNDNVDESAQEDAAEKSGTMPAAVVSQLASSLQEPEDDPVKESLVAGASAKILEPAQEEDSENNAIAQEALVKEPSGGSVQLEGPAQEKSGTWTSTVEEPQNVPVGEDNYAPKEVEYKLAEDVKVPDEHVKDTEEVFPKSQSNLAHVDSDERKPESLASQDSDERVESGESGEEFFDAEQESGHFDAWDSGVPKSFEESVVGPGEPGEASGSNAIAQKSFLMDPLVPSPSAEPAQEPEIFVPEPAQENLVGKSDVALASSEPLVSTKFDHPQERFAEERLAAEPRVKFEEPAQANAAADESDTRDLPFTFKVEEPQVDTVGSSEKNLSSAKFHESGNPELVESFERKPLDEAGIAVDTPGMESTPYEALGKVPLTTSAPANDYVLEHDAGKSDHVHISSEPQLASASEESKEAYVNEPMKAAPSFESFTESAQEGHDGTVAAFSEPATPQKPHEDFAKELSVAALSAFKSGESEESLAEEPRAVAPTSKLAQESDADRSSHGLVVEGPALTSIEEEPRYGGVSSLVDGKHGQNVIVLKPTEDVNFLPGLIEEAFPRSQSDSTVTKLKPEAAQDTEEHLESVHSEKHHDQGSFLAFAAPSVESKEAFENEPSPAAKLVQLFEREDVRRSGTVRQYSPATSMVTEPAEQPLAAVSSSPKVEENHARRRSFSRSTSEPQFVYKSGDHRHAHAKEPSVVVVAAAPSASNLEQHAQEGSADVQCLPFKLLGEGKPRKESELKLAEDVHGSARKTEPAVSYVLEPKPSRIKEKKKREKKDKERKHESPPVEEKAPRRSFRSGEMERKGSVRGEEKDSSSSTNNSLLRSEEKHKQPFRHWRDRLRHAFGTTKDA